MSGQKTPEPPDAPELARGGYVVKEYAGQALVRTVPARLVGAAYVQALAWVEERRKQGYVPQCTGMGAGERPYLFWVALAHPDAPGGRVIGYHLADAADITEDAAGE